jgi:hypothetical protein
MESYEKRSDQADSEADRLAEEGDRVDREIAEAKSDWQSKQGQVPGLEPGDPADPGGAAEAPAEAEEAAEEGDDPSTTSVD